MMKKEKLIGIVGGGGTGPELTAIARRLFDKISQKTGRRFRYEYFDNDRWYKVASTRNGYHDVFLDDLTKFYLDIKNKGGIIIRGALPATTLYKLRERVRQLVKLTPIYPIPELSDLTMFSERDLNEMDILIARENLHGEYHSETSEKEGKVYQIIEYDKKDIEAFAEACFRVAERRAERRKGCLHLMIKDKVLGCVGSAWRNAFEKKAGEYPGVKFGYLYPGVNEIIDLSTFLKHEEGPIDVVACPDNVGDTLMDDSSAVFHGSSCLTPSGNFTQDFHFASYQTIHGAITTKTGRDEVNPVGMIHATAMALEYSLGMEEEAMHIRTAVRKTLAKGYRTLDIYRGKEKTRLVGTKEMAQRIIENL